MLSVSRGISSIYSCGTTCPASFDRGWVDPDPTEVPEGGSDEVEALQINVDSYSNEYGPYSSNVVSWFSSDTNVATVSFGVVNAVGVGSATLTATIEYPLYYYDAFTMDCLEDGTAQTNVNGGVEVNPTISVGTLSLSVTTIKPGTGTVLTITLAASSGIVSTAGTTLEVSITNANGPGFTLDFSPQNVQQVNLSPGESKQFTFNVSVNSAPTSNATCNLAAHVTPASGIDVINNNAESGQLTVAPL